jgi:SAM-dependent methyltransferase
MGRELHKRMPSTDFTERFTGRVDAYRRFRPRYPRELVATLQERCGLTPSSIIADVGAGTGMLAEVLLQNGNPVFAVEPNLEMRTACAELIESYAQLTCVNATAEATGLAANSVDFVTVGRAFHWFDQEKAVAEFQRILRPGGWLVLVGLGRIKSGGGTISRESDRLLRRHSKDYAALRDRYDIAGSARRVLADGGTHESFHQILPLTWEECVGNALSLSITPRPEDLGFTAFEKDLKAFFEAHKSGDKIHLPIVCEMYFGHLR